MDRSKLALRLASSVCLLALAACSGGGGGGSVNTALNNTPANTGGNASGSTSSGNTSAGNTSGNTSSNPTPTVSIGAPDNASVTIQGGPSFSFPDNLPAVGTIFGLSGPAVKVTAAAVEAANKGVNSTLIFRGMVSSGGSSYATFDISIPAIGLNAINVRADGNVTTLPDGGKVSLGLGTLSYTAAAAWTYVPAGSTTLYEGLTAAGWGTPIASVPTSGSASYTGVGAKGGTVGIYYVPSGSGGITSGAITGDVAITANFSTGGVTGTLSNMVATPRTGGAATPWNNITLSANITRQTNSAVFGGSTSTSDAPAGAGAAGFSSAATGGLSGAFYGPNIEEIGGTWTLLEPNAAGGGKTAYGQFVATNAGCSGCNTGGGGTTTPSVSITPPGLGLATFSGPGSNFTTNLPPIGSSIPFGGATAAITSTSVAAFTPGPITATFRGTVTSGGLTFPVFDLSIPGLSLTANNLNGDGSLVTLADGGKVSTKFGGLTYTLMGAWSYTPAGSGTTYLGQVVTGYGTAAASVPTSGSATYAGAGTVIGAYFVPSGTNAIQSGTLSGDVSFNVDFAANKTSGSFTNMQAKALGGSTTTPWNSISWNNGTLSRGTNAVTFDNQASTTNNTGPAGFSNAGGALHGALYGPTAQEVAGTWFLMESGGGGKAAYGTFGAKQ